MISPAFPSRDFSGARSRLIVLPGSLCPISASHSPTRARAALGAESSGAVLSAAANPVAACAIFLARFARSAIFLSFRSITALGRAGYQGAGRSRQLRTGTRSPFPGHSGGARIVLESRAREIDAFSRHFTEQSDAGRAEVYSPGLPRNLLA